MSESNRRVAERLIISGDPGTTWTNDSERVRYQFHAALINTCGVCLQYHQKIGAWWPIPIHYGCRCTQTAVKPGATAPRLQSTARRPSAAAFGLP